MRPVGRYSKVYRHVWDDPSFRALSAPQPNAQTLWFRLLTGPELGCIPGLIRTGEAALAEALGWPMKAFREAFRETFLMGLVKADWGARIVWIPNAILYNVPESPNVVKSWAPEWLLVPECDLKAEAFQTLKAFLEGLGEAWGKPFEKACPKPCPNQEQEQEQDLNSLLSSGVKRARERATPTPRERTIGVIPSDATPDAVQSWATGNGIDPAHVEFGKFLDYHRAKGSTFRDWAAAWRNWLRNAKAFGTERRTSTRQIRAVQPVEHQGSWFGTEVGS